MATTPEVARAIENLDNAQQANWVIKILNTATGFVRATYTLASLDFSAGNIFRDVQEGYLYNRKGSLNPITLLTNVTNGLIRAFKHDKLFYEWMVMGGSQSTLVSPDMNRTQMMIDDLTKSNREKWIGSGVKEFFRQTLESLQKVSEYSEFATRLGVYQNAKNQLAKNRADGKATYEDMRKAALTSREATIDFARGGRSAKTLNKGIAFFNVALQDVDKSAKLFDPRQLKTKDGRKELFDTAVKLGMLSVLPAIVTFATNHDKDWWKNIPNWQKDTSWILSEDLKIPKSLSLASRFVSTLTEEFLRQSIEKRPMETERFLQPFKDAAPSLLPTLVVPLFEAAANYSVFFERPIVPVREQNLPNYMQFNSSTSELAKYVGEKFDLSPRKIDHLISGYLGFIGKTSLQMYDKGLSMSLDEMPMVR